MLSELRIRDYAVIDRLTLRLGPGLNVLTGETGAGKSIIVGALSLLLGQRASTESVRPEAERALVEGVFETDDERVAAALETMGIEAEEGLVILRREVAAQGRSRAWINGSPATVGNVGEVGRLLVDLHGQHEHEALMHVEAQRAILDAFADATQLAASVAEAWRALRESEERLAHVDARRREVESRAEMLRHTATEIEKAKLREGEDEALESEARRLDHAEDLARLSRELHEGLYAAEDSISARLDGLRKQLAQLERIDPEAVNGTAALGEAFHALQEIGRSMGDYASRVEHDPARLDAIRNRQDLLFRLKSRHGPELTDVMEAGRRARAELDQLDSAAFERSALEEQVADRREAHTRLCQQLTERREQAADELAGEMDARMPELGMEGGRFEALLLPVPRPGAHGGETVEFRIAVNAGFEPRSLARVASGGELSRVMLALKSILAAVDRTPTLVFDEIDVGIGGRVAHRVAAALHTVAEAHQVFVVTHLPQIASRAAHHLLVEKVDAEGRASTKVRELDGDARVRELARLLGGDPESAASLEHARELLGAPSP